jgi:hypothetical protein
MRLIFDLLALRCDEKFDLIAYVLWKMGYRPRICGMVGSLGWRRRHICGNGRAVEPGLFGGGCPGEEGVESSFRHLRGGEDGDGEANGNEIISNLTKVSWYS